MKYIYLLCTLALTVSACNKAAQPEATSGKLAEEQQAEIPLSTSITLPDFPDLPAPQTVLESGQEGDIYFPTKSPYDFSILLNGYDTALATTGKGHLVLPKGASANNPVPAMIILHGSGGILPEREMNYAKLFARNGIAGFVVDYYIPRGVMPETPYMIKTLATSEVDVLTDAYAALKVLGTHPAIDAKRIGVTGYSYGGMATRYALNAAIKDILAPDVAPFALHVDVYGPCHQILGEGATTGAPYLAVYGDQDNSVDPDACAVVQADLQENGSEVDAHIMAGAGHAWESQRPRQEYPNPYIRNCTFSYDQESGAFLLNGRAQPVPDADASRADRAFARTQLGPEGMKCVGLGYIIGSDPDTDKKAKSIMLDFMSHHFGL